MMQMPHFEIVADGMYTEDGEMLKKPQGNSQW